MEVWDTKPSHAKAMKFLAKQMDENIKKKIFSHYIKLELG